MKSEYPCSVQDDNFTIFTYAVVEINIKTHTDTEEKLYKTNAAVWYNYMCNTVVQLLK